MAQFGFAEVENNMIAQAFVVEHPDLADGQNEPEEAVSVEIVWVVVEECYYLDPAEIIRELW